MKHILLLAVFSAPVFADNIANWLANLPPYDTRCAAVETRIAAISTPNAQQQDTIVQARAWCRVLTEVRNFTSTNPAFFASFSWSATKAEHWTSGAEYFVGKAESNQDPFAGATLFTRAFKSVMDNSYLYYVVQLPSPYAPPAQYGADIYLHSGGQFQAYWGNTTTPLTGTGGVWVKPTDSPSQSGRFWVKPSCRGENDYKYFGQAGCDEEIAHFLSKYSVDQDRVVVGGGSAGGAGTMRYIGIRPDLVAASYNMTGGLTYGWGTSGMWNNWELQDNFSTTPILHWTCPVAQEGNRVEQRQSMDYFDTLAAAYPGTYVYNDAYDTNPACSHVNIQEPTLSNGWAWLRAKVRNMWPDRIIFQTYSLGALNQMKWFTIDTTTSNALATVNAVVNRAPNITITVNTTNIDRFTLNLSSSLISTQPTVVVSINTASGLTANVGGEVHFWRTSTSPEQWSINANRYPSGPVKRKGISGPLVDFFMQVKPIWIVYGTAGGQNESSQQTLARTLMNQFFNPTLSSGRRTNRDFEGRYIKDSDVTQSLADSANLILIGSATQNSYVANLASFGGGLPITFPGAGQFRINNTTYTEGQYRCQAAGALNDPQGCTYALIFPNPRNQNNYVLLIPETYKLIANRGIDSSQVMPSNADVFVGYLNNYAATVAAITFPQNWGTTGSGAVDLEPTAAGPNPPANPLVGETVTFAVSGGTPPYTWTMSGCGSGTATGTPVTCSYSSEGTKQYSVVDSVGNSGSGTIIVNVASGQSLQIRKRDGTLWTGTLKSHPRSLTPSQVARMQDPDGDGPLQSPRAALNDVAWQALINNAVSANTGVENGSEQLFYYMAIAYYNDHYASFSGDHRQCTGGKLDGSVSDVITDAHGRQYHDCFKWESLDFARNFGARVHYAGAGWLTGKDNNTDTVSSPSPEYWGDNLALTAIGYSMIRDLLTPAERTQFIQLQIAGGIPPRSSGEVCQPRTEELSTYTGTFVIDQGSSTTCTMPYKSGVYQSRWATWTGVPLPQSLVGRTFAYRPKAKEQAFTSATQVQIATAGWRAATAHCWDESGIRIMPSSTTFATNLATVNFASAQSGTCKVFTEIATQAGSIGRIKSITGDRIEFLGCVGGNRQYPTANEMFLVDEGTPQSCSFDWTVGRSSADTAQYGTERWYTDIAAPVKPWDTSVTIANASGLPSIFPYYARLGKPTDNAYEYVKVTAAVGNVLMIVRGLHGTEARAWPAGTGSNNTFQYEYNGAGGEDAGWQNRTISRQVGFVVQALEFYGDHPLADRLLTEASEYYYNNTHRPADLFFDLINNCFFGYGLSRELHAFSYIIPAFYAATGGGVDYRSPWFPKNAGLWWLYTTYPWDSHRWLEYGLTAENHKTIDISTGANNLESAIFLQDIMRGTTEAAYTMQFLDETAKLDTVAEVESGERATIAMMFGLSGTESRADWRTVIPTHFVSRSPAPKNISFLFSKQNWSTAATLFWVAAPDSWSDKFSSGSGSSPLAHYGICKAVDCYIGMSRDVVFAWQDTENGDTNWDNRAPKQAQLQIGAPHTHYKSTGGLTVDTAGYDLEFDKGLDDSSAAPANKFIYARAKLNDAFDPSSASGSSHFGMGLTVTRDYRHLVHFKPTGGQDAIVVFDDAATSAPALFRNQIPYNNNGNTSNTTLGLPLSPEGWTDLSSNGRQVVSTSRNGADKLITDLVRGGRHYISDLGTKFVSSTPDQLIICYDCTADHPARVVLPGGTTWTYSTPATVIYNYDSTHSLYAWVDPADGTIHAAPSVGGTIVSCSGPVACDNPITDWPANAIRLTKHDTDSPCPGAYYSSSKPQDYHCRGQNGLERGVYQSDGYSATAADFLVVHQVVPVGSTAPTVTEITTIDPNFVGVQIAGSTPKVAAFGRGTDSGLFPGSYFTTTHSGTAQYLLAGLADGTYEVRRGGVLITTAAVTTATGALYWEGTSGAYTITATGEVQLTVLTPSLPAGVVGSPYGPVMLQATGGTQPYSWSIASGSLPAGLTFSGGGVISGTPTVSTTGTAITFQVTDSIPNNATRALTIVITDPPPSPTITTQSLPGGIIGINYTASLTCTDCDDGAWSLPAGSLPGGLSLSAGGVISGRPTAAGTYSFTVRVTTTVGIANKSLSIVITTAPSQTELVTDVRPVATGAMISWGYRGMPFSQACTLTVSQASTVIATLESPSGRSTRSEVVTGLSPETTYKADIDCSQWGGTVSFTTLPLTSAHIDLPVYPRMTVGDEVRVEWGYASINEGSPIIQACPGTCSVTIPQVARNSIVQYRIVYRASGADLRTSPIEFIVIQ